jgi:hypothetical protein
LFAQQIQPSWQGHVLELKGTLGTQALARRAVERTIEALRMAVVIFVLMQV